MKHLLIAATLTAALAASASQAASFRAGALEVTDPWSRPAMAGMNGAGFMTITNSGKAADALTAITTSAAAKAEVHSSSMSGGVMSMAKQDRVAIPAGGKVAFAPGGYHVMLIGLKSALKPGDKVAATLTFASGAKLPITFAVGTGAAAPAAAMHDHMGH